jgi:polyisoprenoid-binding protein YceI
VPGVDPLVNRRPKNVLLAAAGAVVVLPVAAYGILALLSHDAPAPASLGSAPEAAGQGPGRADGTWVVADVPTNFVGYRVRERLGPIAAPSDAVGRTTQVDGTVRIDGSRVTALDMTVEVASLDSGTSRRDEFVRDQALDAGTFTTAEFHVDEPVDIGRPARDRVMDLSVPGELTLRDETNDVMFDVQARWNGSTIQAAGVTEIRRSDFGIDVSSRAGFNIDEVGTIEFELTFSPEGGSVNGPPSTLVDSSETPTDEGELRPPCQSDDPVTLDPPVLVTGSTASTTTFALVSGRQQLVPVQSSAGLTGGASWSPDGAEIVYSSSTSPEAPRTLATVPATGGTPQPVPGLSDVTHPDWGPDGRIVYVQWTGETSDIWVADRDGSNASRLLKTPGVDSDPRWSPNGRAVIFTTAAGASNQDVVLIDVDDPELETLAEGPGYEYAPSFTPDGDEVLFVRDGSVFAIGLDGSHERRLTHGPSDVNPEISPDGRRLAFIHDGSLFIATADGSSPTCVMTNQAISGGPRWRP